MTSLSELQTRNCVWCGQVFEPRPSCIFQRLIQDPSAYLGFGVRSIIDDRANFISRVPGLTSVRIGGRQWRRRDMRKYSRKKWARLANSPGVNMRFQCADMERFFAKVYTKSGHIHLYGLLEELEDVNAALEHVLDALQALWPQHYRSHPPPDMSNLRLILCNSGFSLGTRVSLNEASKRAATLHGREICGFRVQNVWCGASCLLFASAHDINIRLFGPDKKKIYIRIYSSGRGMYVSTILHIYREIMEELLELLHITARPVSCRNSDRAVAPRPTPTSQECGDLPILPQSH